MKPDKKLREKYKTDYYDKSDYASNARLLQSIWRTEKGLDFEKYGNFLKLDFAKEKGTNFLTNGIFKIVKYEVKNKHIDGKVIQEPRIWNNLLSSQPLAFNLFGELKLNKELATTIFKKLYPEKNIKQVTAIEFEYSPERRSQKYTGDSSAFDIFIEYKMEKDKKGFFGIEVKYAEDLNDKPAKHKDTYENISIASGIFEMSNINRLKEKPIQQIWRDHLLTLSLFVTNNDYEIGDFIYLYPSANENCEQGIEKYKQTFNKSAESHFLLLTIEKLTETIKENCSENWINEFEDRYLKFGKIENASR
jgi:PD-(D/E)XK nuclease superfamily